ncbi:MAG: precorrin-8X methylmutase [Firmicutes bacterium]|nr:precorrin-8X methylmutase [Bacillota bacterium]
MKIDNIKPGEIEKRSFEIIESELQREGIILPSKYEHIIKRCIHTSADFDYAKTMYFAKDAVEGIVEAIRNGGTIVTDTKMAKSGINKKKLEEYGARVECYIGDEDVATEAKERGVTRSYVSMEKAASLKGPVVFAIGNAPTALFSIVELFKEKKIKPAGVIGVPVGFVNVVESKEVLIDSGLPVIVNRGRKGGSNIAACIVNAILYNQ